MITLELLKTLNPCQDRLENYIKHYNERSFTKRQFMGLKNITHSDKIWVAFRLMTEEQCVLAAADIAESVLHLYETSFPGDMRPRRAIEAARSAASNAANATAHAAARATAHAAAYAAAYAAYAASNASNASNAANATAHAAALAAGGSNEKQIRTMILKHWKD